MGKVNDIKRYKTITETVKKGYNIKISDIKLIREGPDNKVYLIKSNHKNYVARVSKRDIGKEVLFEITWLDYLSKNNIPVVEVIKTTDNKPFSIYNKSVIVLFKFAKGQSLEINPNKKPDLRKVENAAYQLAKIHNVSYNANIKIPRKRNILTEINRAFKIKNKFIKFSEGADKFINDLIFYKSWAEENKDDRYLIHNDYRPGNVFFNGDKVLAILDFDWSCKGPAIKDVAHSLCEWSFPDGAKTYWQDIFDTFLKSYNQEARNKIKLNKDLYRWICFSCLSDTATYLTDLADKNIFKKISSSYMYQKFLYFEGFIK